MKRNWQLFPHFPQAEADNNCQQQPHAAGEGEWKKGKLKKLVATLAEKFLISTIPSMGKGEAEKIGCDRLRMRNVGYDGILARAGSESLSSLKAKHGYTSLALAIALIAIHD